MDDREARKLLAAAVPANVREVCATLSKAGYQAVTVGGAVRDALIHRDPGDWDVASSAHPDEVMKLFRHTIPTGIQHGTVTIVTGKGAHTHVEVTTFRGEGAYTDARRPDHVVFGVPLIEDLARRDLVVNAIAYDPANDLIIDPFGGRVDIERKVLRAVGDAVARFTEDGLRVMRAVRFAAQLEFTLDPETEAGIAPALPSLARVSRERVSDELRKLLGSPKPSLGLTLAKRTRILACVLPELDARVGDVDTWLARIDRAPVELRLAAMFVPLHDRKRIIEIAKALKFSNAEAQLAGTLAAGMPLAGDPDPTPFSVRKQFSGLGREVATQLLALWRLEVPPLAHAAIGARVIGDPFMVKELALAGAEVMTALQLTPGPIVGRILEVLHAFVLEDPARNTHDQLLKRAQELEQELGR